MIREARVEDIPVVVFLAGMFVEESQYGLTLNVSKTRDLARSFLDDPDKLLLLSIQDGNPCGLLAASVTESYFSDDRIAAEIAWYLLPSARGTSDSLRMIDVFEKWAKVRECTLAQLSCIDYLSGDQVAKLYTRKGYSKKESAFVKEIK